MAPLLKEKNIPVILGNVLALPSREDEFHAATYQVAGELAKAGVKIAFSTGDTTNVRLVPYNAAMSVAWGLNRDEALKALTINAAEILGVADRVGSLEAGKDANLFIAKGDPLEIRTQLTHVFIEGRDVGLANKHQALYEKYIAQAVAGISAMSRLIFVSSPASSPGPSRSRWRRAPMRHTSTRSRGTPDDGRRRSHCERDDRHPAGRDRRDRRRRPGAARRDGHRGHGTDGLPGPDRHGHGSWPRSADAGPAGHVPHDRRGGTLEARAASSGPSCAPRITCARTLRSCRGWQRAGSPRYSRRRARGSSAARARSST